MCDVGCTSANERYVELELVRPGIVHHKLNLVDDIVVGTEDRGDIVVGLSQHNNFKL